MLWSAKAQELLQKQYATVGLGTENTGVAERKLFRLEAGGILVQ